MSAIRYQKDSDNIVHMILDRPDASANIMDDAFRIAFEGFMAQLRDDNDVIGVIMSSSKSSFMAGGDLDSLIQVTAETASLLFEGVEATKACMRELETKGIPVVAAINGAALGGGWEMALACHHRIAGEKRANDRLVNRDDI